MMSCVPTCKVDDMEGKDIELIEMKFFHINPFKCSRMNFEYPYRIKFIRFYIATTFISWHGKLQHILLTSRFCFMTFVAIVMYEKDSPFFVVYHKQRQ